MPVYVTNTCADTHTHAEYRYIPTIESWVTGTTAGVCATDDTPVNFCNMPTCGDVSIRDGAAFKCNDLTIKGKIKLDLNCLIEENFQLDALVAKFISKFSVNDGLPKQVGYSTTPIYRETLYNGQSKDLMLPYLKQIFLEIVNKAAVTVGERIGAEIIAGTLKDTNLMKDVVKDIVKDELKTSKIELEVDDETFEVTLNDILSNKPPRICLEGESYIGALEGFKPICEIEKENGRMKFDFDKVRMYMKKKKKELYVAKLKTVSIVKKISESRINLDDMYKFWNIKNKIQLARYSEEEVQRELKALALLRKLVEKGEFNSYLKNRFIDVPDIKGNRTFRIHKDRYIEIIENDKINQSKQALCVHVDGVPKTDEVIAKILLAKTDSRELIKRSNVHGGSGLITVRG